MPLSRLVATKNIELTTTPVALIGPDELNLKSEYVGFACLDNGLFREWQRQPLEDSEHCSTRPDAIEMDRIRMGKGQTIFWVKVESGTGTLEVEWWI